MSRGWQPRALLVVVAVLGVAAFAPAAASAVATGAIEGTVTGADTHEGIEGVEVCATRYGGAFLEVCEYTAGDGTYAIEGLPAAEYEVGFWGNGTGYYTSFYPTAVVVEAEPVTGIDAELEHITAIEGTVTRSSDGAPLEEVLVCAFDLERGEYTLCEETAWDGTYALRGIEAGDYAIEFWPGFTGQNLAFQFYDHRDHLPEADPVSVEAGEVVSGVDGELGPGGTISGHVYSNASGAALEEIWVCAIDVASDELMVCNLTEPDGSYDLPILAAGQYKVVFSIDFEEWFEEEFGEEEDDGFPTEFWNDQTTLAAAGAISLGAGGSVTGIDARLGPPATPSSGGSATVQVQMPPAGLPAAAPPVTVPPVTTAKHKRCPKGFRRKKVRGKLRCVRRRKHHPRRSAGRPGTAASAATALLPPLGRGLDRPIPGGR
ncbi:MAG TPA: carboxypeptidase-like regulatory domain-containing protein [Solirubrobacterales bacterium]|nr:carboxypeptidase-like regulatory domain-containing protein [Solirubrobacterales bacterium]